MIFPWGDKIWVAKLHILIWNVAVYKWETQKERQSSKKCTYTVVSLHVSVFTSHSETSWATEMTDTVLTEKDGHTLVGWDANFRRKVHWRKKSKYSSELHFFSLICLTCIFAGAHPKLECKSSLVMWMSDDYIFAFDHKDSFQVIWVEKKV